LLRVEEILAKNEFIIVGEKLTEADVRLFTTILRFDPVYFGHFKCNLLAIKDCPNTLRWLRMMANLPGIHETINMTHIKVPLSIILCDVEPVYSLEPLLHVPQTDQSHWNRSTF
jgi:glutathionyl-hydroquinone reductase